MIFSLLKERKFKRRERHKYNKIPMKILILIIK